MYIRREGGRAFLAIIDVSKNENPWKRELFYYAIDDDVLDEDEKCERVFKLVLST